MDDADRRGLYPGRVTVQRMEHVGSVVDDLAVDGPKISDGDVENP
jgi:hypothetical protein